MEWREVIKIAKARGINSSNWRVAKISENKKLWWTSIPVAKAKERWVILLHDYNLGGENLHILDIPAGFFSREACQFVCTTSGKKKVKVYALHLSAKKQNLFQDTRARGKGVDFACFQVKAEAKAKRAADKGDSRFRGNDQGGIAGMTGEGL